MKQLLAFFILALGLTCRAQEQTFTLRGTLRNAQPGHALILFDMTGGDFRIDTLRLTDGRFAYTGTCRGREQRTLMLADPVRQARERAKGKGKPTVLYGSFDLSLFVEPRADIDITADAETYPLADIKDARCPMNEDYAAVRRAYAPQLAELNRLHTATNEARWADDSATVARNEARIRTLRAEIDSIRLVWIADHPEREYAACLYVTTYMNAASVPQLEAQYARFAPAVRQSVYGRQILEKIDLNRRVVEGSPAPDFTLADVMTGKDVSPADYRGKYLLLDFWGSWCGPCRASHPHLRALYDKYRDEAFAIVGIAADRNKAVIVEAARQDSLSWPQLCMYEKRDGREAVNKSYNVTAFPTKFLIGPDGTILAICVGNTAQIDERLAEIFGH